jgi:hypothetical protein
MRVLLRTLVPVAVATLVAVGSPLPSGAAAAPKACKLLKGAAIRKVLGAPAKVDPDAQGTQIGGAESCAYAVGDGLGEPGGGLVVLTHYTGGVADGIASEFEPRVTPLGKGVVWDATLDVAYVVKKGNVVGVNITYTSDDPPSAELQSEAAALARAAAKRA